MNKLPANISRNNFFAFLWHASFLAFAVNFIDVDTIMPSMLVEAGGNGFHIGIMTTIMLGGSSLTQLVFARYLSNKEYKKGFLLFGINTRIFVLFVMGLMLWYSGLLPGGITIWLIFFLITIYSLSGAFSNVSYTDLLGKSINPESRKTFFSVKRVVAGIILLLSAALAKKVLAGNEFPINYAWMLFIASCMLLIASLGFWRIKEHLSARLEVKGTRHFLGLLRNELKSNGRLIYFLGFINTMGVSMSLMPFIMLYAKKVFETGSAETGTFLFFKVLGSVATGFLLVSLFRKFKYRQLLYTNLSLVVMLILILLLSEGRPPFFLLFLLGGIITASYSISMNGILLEMSGNENRALYTGITGAGNILPALSPMLGGWIIERTGFQPFFIIYLVLILSSLFFIYKINCKK